MTTPIRIGTRDSALAVWQARQVQQQLEKEGYKGTLVYVKSPADLDLTTPLHQFGSTGIFTKVLDDALLAHTVDIAVHSLKDYPTLSPEGIRMTAMLPRGPYQDILVHKSGFPNDPGGKPLQIATGSIRRQAQWQQRYPDHRITGLRGNVQTRLRKLEENDWDGAIFARAGLDRLDLLPDEHKVLDWMIPAPAQGIIGVTCRSGDHRQVKNLRKIHHAPTALCAKIEREFLRTLEGGCSAPIGALARIEDDQVHFTGGLFEPDGTRNYLITKKENISTASDLGILAARAVLRSGGQSLMEKLRHD